MEEPKSGRVEEWENRGKEASTSGRVEESKNGGEEEGTKRGPVFYLHSIYGTSQRYFSQNRIAGISYGA